MQISHYLPRGLPDALQDWYRQLAQHWQRIHFGNVTTTATDQEYRIEVQVYLDELPPDAVRVELYADPLGDDAPVHQPLQRGVLLAGAANAWVYRGSVPADRPARDYTPRIVPAHEEAIVPLEADFILWYR